MASAATNKMADEPRKRPNFVQISVSASAQKKQIVPAPQTSLSRRTKELHAMHQKWNEGVSLDAVPLIKPPTSPHAVAMSEAKIAELDKLHQLLGRGVVDIVERWFSDEEARFPQRMPLEPREEKLLRWVTDLDILPNYKERAGIWRSDVLFGLSEDGTDDEAPFICEMNGRLPLNALFAMGIHAQGITALGAEKGGVESLNSFQQSWDRTISFFDTSKPLFCLREQWMGVDSGGLLQWFSEAFNQHTAVVRPQDLEVRPDDSSPTGYALWDRATDTRMEQWVSELLQEEWAALEENVARQVALTPLNDLRSIMLVHDKRLLGILADELPGMVARGVLSAEEGDIVGKSIPQTLIPGSDGIRSLLKASVSDPTVKDRYIWKSCRDGYGLGIEIGHEISQEDWLQRLERFASEAVTPLQGAAVIQKLVNHHWYDVVRHRVSGPAAAEITQVHLIASIFLFRAQHVYSGPWRTGVEKHLGLGPGSTGIVMGGVRVPDWPVSDEVEENEELTNGVHGEAKSDAVSV